MTTDARHGQSLGAGGPSDVLYAQAAASVRDLALQLADAESARDTAWAEVDVLRDDLRHLAAELGTANARGDDWRDRYHADSTELERLRGIVRDLAEADMRYVGNSQTRDLVSRAREVMEAT